MPLRFNDMKAGDSFQSDSEIVEEDEILRFATRYDPQPLHTEPALAAKGPFRGLIASGIHTLAISIGLMIRSGTFAPNDFLGSPGIEDLRWLAPVRPGDTLYVVGTILETRPSKSNPDQGLVRYRLDTINQGGEDVMTLVSTAIMRR